jgi:hypothetical protein
VSDTSVTVTLPSGSLAIEAYCSNQAGNSQTTSVNVTVAGTPTPSFAAASGTTINDGEVSRGGLIVVSVQQGGELHYRINGGSWTTASGLSVSLPIATNLSQGQMVIDAYNVEDGDESTRVTQPYTMEALDSPEFSVPTGTEVAEGTTVTITAPTGATLKVNGTAIASQTHVVTINTAQTITAVSVDAYGESAQRSATYSIKLPKITVVTRGATTMNLGGSDIPLAEGTNEFSSSDLGGSAFEKLSFGDATLIKSFDSFGMRFGSLYKAFEVPTSATDTVESVTGIILDPTLTQTNSGSMERAFYVCKKLATCKINGTVTSMASCFQFCIALTSAQLELPESASSVSIIGAFGNCSLLTSLDLSGININGGGVNFVFAKGCTNLEEMILDVFDTSGASSTLNMFQNTTKLKKIVCKNTTPQPMNATNDWIAALKTAASWGATEKTIHIPVGSLSAYSSASVWSNYVDNMIEDSSI